AAPTSTPPATPAAAPPVVAPPAAPPSWQQGRTPEQGTSTLHPFAPQMTGRPASELPIDKLKVPAGFKVEVWVDGVPEARSLALGPDGKLYFNIGSPQNITMPTYMQAVIMRVDPTSGRLENYAQGVRNTVGFDWHPQTKQLWFTDHGRDWISDDLPEDELNVV